ncbi:MULTISPECIES: hypothetical protein [Rhizobium]|uniref:Uncharacterized protein n=1 Tax=Rhizobium paranaense TaxID=1650438 RepID=A0A7W9D3R8_9HYPH|nr:hypothetical protein [Rhizobium paranaense]MBB5576677.1 hypothetical protein [Rhizobium paranaense]
MVVSDMVVLRRVRSELNRSSLHHNRSTVGLIRHHQDFGKDLCRLLDCLDHEGTASSLP